ncbi:hypothetical protein D0Z03_000446 [Geotrichum reessii]|nr:hypothetical protein D0Z03_000446 [Galactomyces reessii]
MCILLTTENIELKSIKINDKQHFEDTDESQRLVEIRYGAAMQNAQFFVMSRDQVEFDPKDNGLMKFLFSSKNNYGTDLDSVWPPWLSVDCFYDSTPLKETLVIERTSVFLSYVKPNSLRIHANNKNAMLLSPASIRDTSNRQNRIKVDFPKVAVHCDSQQFFALITVVIDLLIYTEPTERERSERLDKVMLATDFTDLKNITERINHLQTSVRNFQDVKMEFVARLPMLSPMQLVELEKIELEQTHALLELFVMMEAIRTGMERKTEEDEPDSQTSSSGNDSSNNISDKFLKFCFGANQVIVHVLDPQRKPFLDIGLAEASFNRIQGTDGFNVNSLQLGIMQAFNLVPGTTYPELFAPYIPTAPELEKKKRKKEKKKKYKTASEFLGIAVDKETNANDNDDDNHDSKDGKENNKDFVNIDWTMLEPIGGITIVENFDIDLKPIKLQIDSRTWDMLFEYLFPNDRDQSPFNVRKHRSKSVCEGSDSESDEDTDSDDEPEHHRRTSQHEHLPMKRSPTTMSISSRLRNTKSTSNDASASADASAAARNKDEISIMLNRASNYMSLVHARLKPSTMCVSYKRSDSSIFNIHELVIDLPEISYRNKTWSHLDLVLRLKKDVTKLLLGNTGRVVGNVLFSSNEQSKAAAAATAAIGGSSGKLRQLTDYKEFMAVSELVQHPDESAAAAGGSGMSAGIKRRLRSATNGSLKKLQLPTLQLSLSPSPSSSESMAWQDHDAGNVSDDEKIMNPHDNHHNTDNIDSTSLNHEDGGGGNRSGPKRFFKKLLK